MSRLRIESPAAVDGILACHGPRRRTWHHVSGPRPAPVADGARRGGRPPPPSPAPLLAWIGGLGQPGLLMRRYSLRPPGHFDWVADTLRALAFSLPGLGLCVAGAAMLYPLSLGGIAFLGAAAPPLVLGPSAATPL